MVSLRIASAGKETGALLQEYLKNRKLYDENSPNVVSYGVHVNGGKNVLNANAGRGKDRALTLMRQAGIRTVPFWFAKELEAMSPAMLETLKYPLFGRKFHGYGAKDLAPVFQPEEVAWRIASGSEWFSTYVPIAKELRVWVFKNEVLDSYEKVMERPTEYQAMGRNFGQGFEFRPTTASIAATIEATKAVRAIGLDFAAVDILIGKDHVHYILECNTAPGVIRSGCQSTLLKLVDKIQEWDQSLGHVKTGPLVQ